MTDVPTLVLTSQWRPQPWKDTPAKLIFYWDISQGPPLKSSPLKTLGMKDPANLSPWSLPVRSPTPFPQACFPCPSLSLRLQGPFFCLCILFPEPISSTAHFCLWDFLNKLSLIVWVLALNSSLARTQVPRWLNQGLVWLCRSNTWCHFTTTRPAPGGKIQLTLTGKNLAKPLCSKTSLCPIVKMVQQTFIYQTSAFLFPWDCCSALWIPKASPTPLSPRLQNGT